jgi:hypothetical protein
VGRGRGGSEVVHCVGERRLGRLRVYGGYTTMLALQAVRTK